MTDDWPFDNVRSTATLTSRYVLEGEPICFASRDWEDGMWQFLPRRETKTADGRLVCLGEIFRMDPSVGELADLPLGWMATRTGKSGWSRQKNHPFPVFAEVGFYLEDATEYARVDPEKFQIPSAEVRENLQVGDGVKLSFRFAGEWSSRGDNQCEWMWVEVSEVDSENLRYRGTLLNEPKLHDAIAEGDELWFHATHVLKNERD